MIWDSKKQKVACNTACLQNYGTNHDRLLCDQHPGGTNDVKGVQIACFIIWFWWCSQTLVGKWNIQQYFEKQWCITYNGDLSTAALFHTSMWHFNNNDLCNKWTASSMYSKLALPRRTKKRILNPLFLQARWNRAQKSNVSINTSYLGRWRATLWVEFRNNMPNLEDSWPNGL